MTEEQTERQLTEEAAGELRQRLRDEGWRADAGWTAVGSGSAVQAEGETKRTLAYLASVRAVDGGAAKLWKEGDVPVPAEADAREVLVARAGDSEWHSEVLEAPAVTVAREDSPSEEETAARSEVAY